MRGIGEAYLYEREKLMERQLMEGIKLSAFGITF